jgi:hypothetical protein
MLTKYQVHEGLFSALFLENIELPVASTVIRQSPPPRIRSRRCQFFSNGKMFETHPNTTLHWRSLNATNMSFD